MNVHKVGIIAGLGFSAVHALPVIIARIDWLREVPNHTITKCGLPSPGISACTYVEIVQSVDLVLWHWNGVGVAEKNKKDISAEEKKNQ